MMNMQMSKILSAVLSQSRREQLAIPILAPKDTGLPMTVCLETRDSDHNRAQIKVSLNRRRKFSLNRLVSVSISDDPRIVGGTRLPRQDLRLVRAWILLNREVLLRHWNHNLSTEDMMEAIRPLGRPRGRR